MIHIGDCIESMRNMDAGSVHSCITSPPYFGLRDYGVDGQIGLEETPAQFVAKLVEVFAEVHRVLRDDGTLWLNLGDSYAGGNTTGKWREGSARADGKVRGDGSTSRRNRNGNGSVAGVKPKELIGIPWRLAFALQDFGWYLRQEIIWHKPNPMPESVNDRCTKAHEHIFLLSKSPRYYFDQGAIREQAAASSVARWAQNVEAQVGSARVPGKTNGTMKAVGGRSKRNTFARDGDVGRHVLPGQRAAQHRSNRDDDTFDTESRNKRSVWTVPTMPFKEAHFATFPERLIEPCVLAGAPAGGVVLDPFMGAGTTAVVAERLGRRWIGCELNPQYAEMANRRVRAVQPGLMLGDVA